MKKNKIIELYHETIFGLPDDADITSIQVVIFELDDNLSIGLKLKYDVEDGFPELDGIYPMSYTLTKTIKRAKPLTLRELVKVSKIWKELIIQSGLNNP